MVTTPESLQWASSCLFPDANLLHHDPRKSPSLQSLCSGLQPLLPRHGARRYPPSHPEVPRHCPSSPVLAGQQVGASTWPTDSRGSIGAFPKSAGGSGAAVQATLLASPCWALPWPPLPAGVARWRPWVLVSGTGSGPPVPALPGTGPSPAPLQSPSHHSPLLPLPAVRSWCRRCAGLGRRLGSGSSPALAARWPHTAARDREGRWGEVTSGARPWAHASPSRFTRRASAPSKPWLLPSSPAAQVLAIPPAQLLSTVYRASVCSLGWLV